MRIIWTRIISAFMTSLPSGLREKKSMDVYLIASVGFCWWQWCTFVYCAWVKHVYQITSRCITLHCTRCNIGSVLVALGEVITGLWQGSLTSRWQIQMCSAEFPNDGFHSSVWPLTSAWGILWIEMWGVSATNVFIYIYMQAVCILTLPICTEEERHNAYIENIIITLRSERFVWWRVADFEIMHQSSV